MNRANFLSGQFLLAMPSIGDPRFERAVIALCAHDEAGALGLCVHETAGDLTVPELMRQLDIEPGATSDRPVLWGGPVEPERGFVLHSPDWGGRDSLYVADRWVLTGTRDVLEAIAGGGGPAHWVVALGHTGWAPGQLDGELGGNAWFTTPATAGLLWEEPIGNRWRRGFAAAGVDVALLSQASGRA